MDFALCIMLCLSHKGGSVHEARSFFYIDLCGIAKRRPSGHFTIQQYHQYECEFGK